MGNENNDHERRISDLERSRNEQWEKLNTMYAMVKVLYDRSDRMPSMPCAEHRDRMDKMEGRLSKLESTGSRFTGMWDLAKVGLGALIPLLVFALTHILQK